MRETNFNTIMVKSLRAVGFHSHKIPDVPRSPGPGGAIRFIPQKPYDIFSAGDRMFAAFEGKLLKPKTKSKYCSFNLAAIKAHQVEHLCDADKLEHGGGYLALYVWRPNEIKEVNIIPINYIASLEDDAPIRISANFLEQYVYKYRCYKDVFQLPEDFGQILADIKKMDLSGLVNDPRDKLV